MFYTKSNNFEPGIYVDYTNGYCFVLKSYSPRTMCGNGYFVESLDAEKNDEKWVYGSITRFDLERLDYIGG